MAKTRSPSYPAIGLKEAVEKVAAVYAKDYQNRIPRQVAAEHMGYQSLNGKSLGVLSSLLKYGLLEGRGDDTRVSDVAVAIIAHEAGSGERLKAIQIAAALPELFNEIDARFQGGRGSDQAIRAYLMTQKFIPSAADAVIRAYRETKQLVAAESAGYSPDREAELIEEAIAVSDQSRPAIPKPAAMAGPVLNPDEPYRVSFTPTGIEVVGKLTTEASADDFVRVINSLKLLLKPPGQIKNPVAADDEKAASP